MRTLRTAADLAAAGFARGDLDVLEAVGRTHAIAAPPALLALIDRDDPNDPIARQIIPDARELDVRPEDLADPIGDHAHSPVEGIVHRHPDRVLFKVVSVCPVYCRFCFRREMVGPEKSGALSPAKIAAALDYIRSQSGIWEVILTGGDPFMLSAARAAELTRQLEAIPHVKVIRWHTRMPVADPARVSDEFVAAIASDKKPVYVAIHANHARELSAEARAACARMNAAGIVLISQTVLLRGVNDSIDALTDLMRAFVEARVKPYYLHHADLAPGTSHFRTSIAEGQALVRGLRDTLSGLAVPTYVVDIPGGVSKALAAPSDVELSEAGATIRGRDGVWHRHPAPDGAG